MKDINKSSIIYLRRSQLEPHPDNPRKGLGDLEELKESIREHGIMQNLTVIPTDDTLEHFRILIGHRRFAASEGILTELPCVMVEGLTEREQIGIMLMENMQRTDLTYIEQAHGFQLMLDLGDTIQSISEKTGLSEKTVKSRLEINKLDEETLAETSERFQLSIGDFMKLNKIKDVKKRNEILESVDNSTELADEVDEYLEEQGLDENFQKYKAVLDEVGWKDAGGAYFGGSDWKRLSEFGYQDVPLKNYNVDFVHRIRNAAEAHEKDDVYYSKSYRYIAFAIKLTKEQKKARTKTKEELRQEEIGKKSKALEKARAEICDEYLRFIINLPDKDINELTPSSYKNKLGNCIRILEKNGGYISNLENYKGGIRTMIHEEMSVGEAYKASDPLKKVFFHTWYELATSYKNHFSAYNLEKSKPTLESHASFYSVLFSFGFRLPKELLNVIEGTSDLYLVEGKKVE